MTYFFHVMYSQIGDIRSNRPLIKTFIIVIAHEYYVMCRMMFTYFIFQDTGRTWFDI